MDNLTIFCCDGRQDKNATNISLKAVERSMDLMKCKGVFCSPFTYTYKGESFVIDSLLGVESYSQWILSESSKYITTDFALFVQWDGFVLDAKRFLPEFLEYDYIGAPWPIDWPISARARVGNGGFSLRSKKLLQTIKSLDILVYEDAPAEDTIISVKYRQQLEDRGIKFAPPDLAAIFSFENLTEFNPENTFGFHGTTNELTKSYCNILNE